MLKGGKYMKSMKKIKIIEICRKKPEICEGKNFLHLTNVHKVKQKFHVYTDMQCPVIDGTSGIEGT